LNSHSYTDATVESIFKTCPIYFDIGKFDEYTRTLD